MLLDLDGVGFHSGQFAQLFQIFQACLNHTVVVLFSTGPSP